MPKFSVITPVYAYDESRQKMMRRSARSIVNQTFEDFEHIIVDDGSKVPLILPKDERQVTLTQAHQDRAIAYDEGLKKARGEWICFLDSDDEYLSDYLEAVNQMILAYPESKVFNFGSIHIHRNFSVSLKPTFKPNTKDTGHEIFRSGKIVNGTFVFHRSCYETLGGFPQVTNCWDFADAAFKEFPETKEMYLRADGKYSEVGNPWGQDWYYFYKLTRRYHSKPVDVYLYLVHPRQGHDITL